MVPELLDRAAGTYASWFRALDPSRVQIVEYLARQGRPTSVGDLFGAVGLAQSGVLPENTASPAPHHAAGFRTVGVPGRADRHASQGNRWRDAAFIERRGPTVA